MIDIKYTEWGWYSSTDEENYDYGPFATKEEAWKEADLCSEAETIYVLEGRKEPLNIFNFIDFNEVLGDADERACEDFGGPDINGPIFEYDDAQRNDLINRLKTVFDEWQKDNKIMALPYVFTEIRNEETITHREENEKEVQS